jgi:hypothetical protein
MGDLTRSDLPMLAARARYAGELLDGHGETVWRRLEEWQAGARAANYDPDGPGGWRYAPCGDETCTACPHPIPSDPTGEGVIAADDAAALHGRFVTALAALDAALAEVTNLVGIATPERARRAVKRPTAADVAADGWCRSCYRDNRHLEPAARPRYADLCRFCGDWRAAHDGQDPPRPILEARHRGERITTKLIAQVDADRKAARRKGKKRGRR